MKPIATFSFAPMRDSRMTGTDHDRGPLPWVSLEAFLAVARRSVESMYNLYGKVTIYTDSYGAWVFQQLLDPAHVDIQTTLDCVHDNVTTDQWAYSKLLTYSDQTEPYIHFDLDFILLQPLTEDELAHDVVYQWRESTDVLWDENTRSSCIYNARRWRDVYKNFPSILDEVDMITWAPNVGILVMNNMDLNEEYCLEANHIFGVLRDDINYHTKLREGLAMGFKTLQPAVYEQQLLGYMIETGGYSHAQLWEWNNGLNSPWNDRFIHFMGWAKHLTEHWKIGELHAKEVDPYITDDIKQIASKMYVDLDLEPMVKSRTGLTMKQIQEMDSI